MKILKSKYFAMCAIIATVLTLMTATCFAEGTAPAPGTLPPEVTTVFSTLASGLIITIGAVAVIAIGVFAAPQAIVFAKKMFKKISA